MSTYTKPFLVATFSIGLGLIFGGPAFGIVGRLLGEDNFLLIGFVVGVIGAVLAVAGGIGLLVERKSSRRGNRFP